MIQKDSYEHETYFDMRSLVTTELEKSTVTEWR